MNVLWGYAKVGWSGFLSHFTAFETCKERRRDAAIQPDYCRVLRYGEFICWINFIISSISILGNPSQLRNRIRHISWKNAKQIKRQLLSVVLLWSRLDTSNIFYTSLWWTSNQFRSKKLTNALFQLLLDPPVLIIFFIFYVIKAEPPISGEFFQANFEKKNSFRVPLHLFMESDCRMVVLLPLSRSLLEGWPPFLALIWRFSPDNGHCSDHYSKTVRVLLQTPGFHEGLDDTELWYIS